MTHRWLHLRLAAPLMAFGDVKIDHVGPTREFPSASALTGLLANALGWRREEASLHQGLQDRLVFGALSAMPEGRVAPLSVADSQNARLYESEPAWTSIGIVEARNRSPSYSNSPEPTQYGNQAGRKWMTHRLRRDYLADHETRVVLRLDGEGTPTLDDVSIALDRPARPLFIGRKSCLPSCMLFAGWVEGADALSALRGLGLKGRALWADDAPPNDAVLRQALPDMRNWTAGLHAGSRIVNVGEIV